MVTINKPRKQSASALLPTLGTLGEDVFNLLKKVITQSATKPVKKYTFIVVNMLKKVILFAADPAGDSGNRCRPK